MKGVYLLLGLLMTASPLFADGSYKASFASGGWNQSDWSMVKSWRWPHRGEWLQKESFIVNDVPEDASPQELQGKRVDKTFTSMLLKQQFQSDATFSSTMEFDYRMAPGLMIAAEPVETELGLEYREHYEIILYDKGINIWRHYFEDGEQKWVRRAFLTTEFAPKTAHKLTAKVQFTRRGPQIVVEAGGHVFGYHEPNLPESYRIGIVASEGVNRFYDFEALSMASFKR